MTGHPLRDRAEKGPEGRGVPNKGTVRLGGRLRTGMGRNNCRELIGPLTSSRLISVAAGASRPGAPFLVCARPAVSITMPLLSGKQ